MNLNAERYLDLREIAEDLGSQTFSFRGNTVRCIPTTLEDGTTIVRGGYEHQIELRLIILAEDFPSWGSTIVLMGTELFTMGDNRAVPIAGQAITFRQRGYRIVSARAAADMQHHELLCADMNSGK